MAADSGASELDRPVDRYARLWHPDGPVPDVFQFLASCPRISLADRIDVLLIDQAQRWTHGQPLPLRVYLSAYPEIAERGELIRVLVDGERHHRRRSAGRLNETMPDPSPGMPVSASPTEAIPTLVGRGPVMYESSDAGAKVAVAAGASPAQVAPTGSIPIPTGLLHPTRGPEGGEPIVESNELAFQLDEKHMLRSEAEILRAMLDSVRFTLVRRIGTGGMGVVYEAYDQKRGELVALKTMRRVDATALARFKQEFRSLADITHPNLVNLYELFAVDDRWFFTMELVEGTDLVSHVRSTDGTQAPWSRSPDVVRGSADVNRTDAGQAVRKLADPDEIGADACGIAGPASAPASSADRPAASFDEDRLRDAIRQLAEGVEALHRAGKLHRDIKPTNVLVTLEGRVVLLDFGLTADLEASGLHRTSDRQIVGTAAHMSPEQAGGVTITAASDWYSVGVILFEAMTGQLPFTGTPQELILAKQTGTSPSPSELVTGLPEDLVRLCNALLDRDPSRRPSGRAIIARLCGLAPGSSDAPEPTRPLPLIGRAPHLHILNSVFRSLARGRPQSIFVFGRTGTGKTTLIRAFLDDLITHDEAVVLTGRCYERESVPYKALDSLIDALARYLKSLPPRRAQAYLPADVAHLARLFPVLLGVPAVAEARRSLPTLPDQQELRRRAFAGLRALLDRLAARFPVVLAVDDLQWGDVDSALLLSDLIGSPHAPAVMFLGSFRAEDADDCPFLNELRRSFAGHPSPPELRELAVEALTLSESRALALALLGRDDSVARAQAHVVARESEGNPLFIDELVKHFHGGGPLDRWDAIGRLNLDEVLWERIVRLPEEPLRLLATVAISGRPISQSAAFHAADLGTGGRVALAALRTARLIRLIGRAQQDQVETYHDRIRETVAAHLEPDQLSWHHARLAAALDADGPVDPEVLAEHYRGAGQLERASEYYARGADQAQAALAFEHAARLYRSALELSPGPAEGNRPLWRKLGDALANAGRGAEAAEAYLAAARIAPSNETLELKRLASTQLLISGKFAEGLALLRTILAPLGIRMPETPRGALVSLLWNRALLRLRGLGFQRRDERDVPPGLLIRIDVCWSAVTGLSMFEPIRGADFQARGLLLALRAGEPYRLARALAMEAGHEATAGLPASERVGALLATAEELAESIDSAHARGLVELIRGIAAILCGRWMPAEAALDRAESIFANQCTGVAWERDTGQNFALWVRYQMGRIGDLKRRWTVLVRDSQERGDRYAISNLTAFYATVLRLAANEVPESEIELEESLRTRGSGTFTLHHSAAIDSLTHIDLYRGDVTRAWVRLEATWPAYERSMLLRIQHTRIQLHELRARTAVAAAERAQQSERLLALAERDARVLEAEGQGWSIAHAWYIRAAVASCREDATAAASHLARAAELFDAAEMPLKAHIMRYRIGEIQSDDVSRELKSRAESWLKEQGIVAPARWAGMLAPGFSRSCSDTTETSV